MLILVALQSLVAKESILQSLETRPKREWVDHLHCKEQVGKVTWVKMFSVHVYVLEEVLLVVLRIGVARLELLGVLAHHLEAPGHIVYLLCVCECILFAKNWLG